MKLQIAGLTLWKNIRKRLNLFISRVFNGNMLLFLVIILKNYRNKKTGITFQK